MTADSSMTGIATVVGPLDRLPNPQAMWVGPWEDREFAAARVEFSTEPDWQTLPGIDEACQFLRACEQPPELIFLAQPLPGQYCQAEIDQLQQLAPLARLVVVAGSWCEGELRTGAPPTGVIRLYWYELAPWWRAALRRYRAGMCPLWSLPLDHAQAGRWSPDDNALPASLKNVLIHAADFAVYEALTSALGQYGITTHRRGSERTTADAGIWDGGQLGPKELAHLSEFCRQVTGPVVALLDFPRVEHLRQARAAGATAVLGKPYVAEELVATLQASS